VNTVFTQYRFRSVLDQFFKQEAVEIFMNPYSGSDETLRAMGKFFEEVKNIDGLNVVPNLGGFSSSFIRLAGSFDQIGEKDRSGASPFARTVTEEDGRVYPLSDTAGSVVDVLRLAMESAGVRLLSGCEALAVEKTGAGFRITGASETVRADRVIIACGGSAGERFGGSMLGYRLLEKLGHSCTPLRYSLVQLRSDSAFCRALKGIRADAAVTAEAGGKILASSAGEVQFTDYGLSGPAVFEVSRAALSRSGVTVKLEFGGPEVSPMEWADEMSLRFISVAAEVKGRSYSDGMNLLELKIK